MRLPIILALIVIITLPKDVNGFVADMSAQAQVATASIGKLFNRHPDPHTIKVADLKTKHDTAKNSVGNIR